MDFLSGIFGNLTDLSNWGVGAYPLGGNPFEGSFVYVLAGNYSNPNISKFDADTGSFLWSSNITLSSYPIATPTFPSHTGSSVRVLAIYQGQVVIENSNQILSLNSTSGDQLWSRDIGVSLYQPTTYQGMLFFGAADGNFYALNMAAGTLAWKNQVDTYNLISKVNNDNITLTTYTIQVDAQNQRLYWSFGVTKQLGTNSGDKHDTYTGTVCSLDLATGNVVWTRQLEDSGVFCSPPVGMVVNKDTLYLTENTALWVFSASNGNLARTQHFDHYVLPPVMSNNQVFVASDLQLTAYGYH